MADAVRSGHRVVCVHMTRGEAGLSFRRPCRPETLARIRESELEAALTRLGVEEQRYFDYPDGALAHVAKEDAIAGIYDVFLDVRPDVILTFGPDGFTGHPDHQVLSRWVTRALRSWNNPQVSLYHSTVTKKWKESFAPALNEFDFFWRGHPDVSSHPDAELALDDGLLDAKIEALRKHASQMKPLFDSYGEEFMRAVAATEHFDLAPEPRRRLSARCRWEDELAA